MLYTIYCIYILKSSPSTQLWACWWSLTQLALRFVCVCVVLGRCDERDKWQCVSLCVTRPHSTHLSSGGSSEQPELQPPSAGPAAQVCDQPHTHWIHKTWQSCTTDPSSSTDPTSLWMWGLDLLKGCCSLLPPEEGAHTLLCTCLRAGSDCP